MQFQISGLALGQPWIIYARNRATADHEAVLFRASGYTDVTITEQEPI